MSTRTSTVGSEHGAVVRHWPREVLLLQTAVAHYQHAAFGLLARRLDGRLVVASGRDYFDPMIRSTYSADGTLYAENVFLGGRRFLWQRGVARYALRAEAVICELNPRILSTWLILASRRLLHRPTILWGHAWPRRGSEARTDVVRGLMRSMANLIIVYSEAEAVELRQRTPLLRVIAAPNAMYTRDEIGVPVPGDVSSCDFVYAGRLIEEKHPDLLARAFLSVRSHLPSTARLIIVGDGPLRDVLEPLAAQSEGSVLLLGQITDTERLRAVYANAVASVSPGTVGLSIVQSFAFGVPMIIADAERHGPEVSYAIDGWNALMFAAGCVEDLARRLVEIADARVLWAARRSAIAEECLQSCSVDVMVDRVMEAIEIVLAVSSRAEQRAGYEES